MTLFKRPSLGRCIHKFFLLFLFILFNNHSQAQDVTVVTEDIAPYQFINDQGQLDGYCFEVIDALLSHVKQSPKINVMTWARAYDIALRHPNTLIFSIARTKEREQKFHWIGKLLEEHLYVWGMKKNFSEPIDNIKQLSQYNVATTRSSYAEPFLRKNNFHNLHLSTKEDQILYMLYNQRVDLIVGTKSAVKARVNKLHLDFDAMTPVLRIPELDSSLNVAMSKNSDQQTIALFQQAFKEITDNGVIAKIKEKWQM